MTSKEQDETSGISTGKPNQFVTEPPNQSAPGPPPPAYPSPVYPVPQAQYGFPQYAPGPAGQPFPTHPGYQAAYGAIPVQLQPAPAPTPVIWMPTPPALPKCPPGLECLSQIDQLVIQQQMELMEMISGFESCNRYEVKNTLGQLVYFAVEENDDFTLNCYGTLRPFTIKLFDSMSQVVMQLSRTFQCDICCCPCLCCLQQLEVQAPPGTIIGYMKQKWHPCLPRFAIRNETNEDILKVEGPCVPCLCYQDVHFEVKSLDEKSTLGGIHKQWTGLAREAATDASNFGIQFPLDLDIKMKALLLASVFLLDFMYFERQQNRPRRS